jgi:carboxypeptidase Q
MHILFNRSRRSALLLALLVPCVASAVAGAGVQDGDLKDPKVAAQKFIDTERDHSEVMNNLEYLSDMIGPRLTGSGRLKRANDWTAEKMKSYGLENVHLESYTIPRGWERGKVEMTIVENGLTVEAAQSAWTPGTPGKITGPVIVFNPRTEADLAAYKGKLKNAILLSSDTSNAPSLPDAKPTVPIPALSLPGAENAAPAAPGGRRQGGGPGGGANFAAFRKARNEFLQSEGAAVVLTDSGKPHALLNMTGSWTSNATLPTLFVSHEYVAMMQRMLKRGVPVHATVEVTSKFVEGPITVYNTVGEIKGSEKPNEIVLLGAHLDSWDLGTGSTDNGTGSMAVLEAARIIKALGVAPKRTMRFVLFTGEEEGLMGSKAYVEAHKADMDKYDVVFIHDTGTGRVKGAWLQGRAEDKPMLEAQFGMLKDMKLMTDDLNLLPGKMNGTDHASFDDAGVPAFAFNQDPAEYSLTHHSQSDTFDKVRADDLKQGVCALAIMGYTAAQSPDRYPRKP